MAKYGMLLVSHVPAIVDGIEQLIKQVAPDVSITTAGGTDDNEVGTSIEKISAAIDENPADELLVFYDLGSAKMNLDIATELADKPLHIYDVAIVEGSYTAAALLQVDVDLSKIESDLAPLKIK